MWGWIIFSILVLVYLASKTLHEYNEEMRETRVVFVEVKLNDLSALNKEIRTDLPVYRSMAKPTGGILLKESLEDEFAFFYYHMPVGTVINISTDIRIKGVRVLVMSLDHQEFKGAYDFPEKTGVVIVK